MSDEKRPKDQEFSPELLHAISADETGCYIDLPLLSKDDVEVLKQVLQGQKLPPVPIDKKRAVNALARSERSQEASEILGRVVSDTKETKRVRATAASHLSLMPQEAAEKALLENLTTADEIVRREVFKSLGRVGTARALDRIKKLPDPKTSPIARQLSLAKLAISSRSGSEERDSHDKASSLHVGWATQAVKAVEGNRVRENIEAIWGSTYGVSLNPEIGFEIDCGRTKLIVLLNDTIKRGAFTKSAVSRKMIAGLVVAEEEETRHLTVRFLIMTSPSEKGVEVVVARTNGEVAYVGEARPNGDEFHLAMRDVGLERMATELEGRISNVSMQLDLRVWRGSVRPKKHPVPIRS
jgi:hypothetical protein